MASFSCFLASDEIMLIPPRTLTPPDPGLCNLAVTLTLLGRPRGHAQCTEENGNCGHLGEWVEREGVGRGRGGGRKGKGEGVRANRLWNVDRGGEAVGGGLGWG